MAEVSPAPVPDLLAGAAWELVCTPPGLYQSPRELVSGSLAWRPAVVPGTVATSVLDEPVTGLLADPGFDGSDWWYRVTLPPQTGGEGSLLRFEGLATLAEAWVGEERVLVSRNMFRPHAIALPPRDVPTTLHIAFRSVTTALAARRARPRWKTALVGDQGLRWLRTSLLGRIPAWTPPVPAIGPWRPVHLQPLDPVALSQCVVSGSLQGRLGVVRVRALLQGGAGLSSLVLRFAGAEHPLGVSTVPGGRAVEASVAVDAPEPWWPHTHGEPRLHAWSLEAHAADGRGVLLAAGRVGFRTVGVHREQGNVSFSVNGVPVFCRGACWTSAGIAGLPADAQRLRCILQQARDAGMNMVRVGGTTAYESREFYALCDELGIMVWQDFMFANMDYPFDDPEFAADAEAEARGQAARLSAHACLAAWCGNSEVEQQAAMRGVPEQDWRHAFFDRVLPAICAELAPGVPYFPSTPCGGALPFHTAEGLAHYYGVGAYQRDFADLQSAGVRFSPECLGFSHVPGEPSVLQHFGTLAPPVHLPAWKAGVPRDAGSGWDFEDVRDHYLRRVFGVDPVALRYADAERYLALSRVASGEALARAFAWWRSAASGCGGALVWTLLDLVPGAGWGLIDVDARAKPALHLLGRHLQPVQVLLVDRGLDGHLACVINERPHPLRCRLVLELWGIRGAALAEAGVLLEIEPRGYREFPVDGLFGRFLDTTYAYRFGPLQHEALSASLLAEDGTLLSQVVSLPGGREPAMQRDATLYAEVIRADPGDVLRLYSDTLLLHAAITLRGYEAADDMLSLLPGREYRIALRPRPEQGSFRGSVAALNAPQAFRIPGPA